MTRSNKQPKDPHAPKKPLTSYFIFSNSRRTALRVDNPEMAVTEMSKLISKEWREMSDKTQYEQQAKVFREQYTATMTEYKQTENYRVHQAKVAHWKKQKKEHAAAMKAAEGSSSANAASFKAVYGDGASPGKPPKKPKNPPGMPKKPSTSYILFSNERRPILREQHNTDKLTDLAKLISKEWRVLTSEQKRKFEDQAKVLKEQYNAKMEVYKKCQDFIDYDKKVDQWRADLKAHKKSVAAALPKPRLPKKPVDPACPKRPQSSYFLYSNEVRNQVRQEHPTLKLTEIAKVISGKWRELTNEQRMVYDKKAKALKAQYVIDLKKYQESDSFENFKKKELAEWEQECRKREQRAREKYEKARLKLMQEKEREAQAAAAKKGKAHKGSSAAKKKKKGAPSSSSSSSSNVRRRKKRSRYESDSDSSGYSSGSSYTSSGSRSRSRSRGPRSRSRSRSRSSSSYTSRSGSESSSGSGSYSSYSHSD